MIVGSVTFSLAEDVKVKLSAISGVPLYSARNFPHISLNDVGTELVPDNYYINSHLMTPINARIYMKSDVTLGDIRNFSQGTFQANKIKTEDGYITFQCQSETAASPVGTIAGRSWKISSVYMGDYPYCTTLSSYAIAASIVKNDAGKWNMDNAELIIPFDTYPYIYEITFETVSGDVYTIYPYSEDLISEDIFRTYYGDRLLSYSMHNDWVAVIVPYLYENPFPISNIVYEEINSEPYEPGGTSGVGGGGGNFGQGVPNDNVTVDIPSGSNFGYVGGSMFTHYALSGNQVELFGEWLWTEDLGLSLWKTAMEKIFNETADALVGLMAFPFNISTLPNVSLVDGTIKAGNLPTGIPARILQSPYTQVDWGTIQLTEYWGNFLDYAPHTKIELYLPWSTGFVPIDPHQVMPDPITRQPVPLSVKTNIDLQCGRCTHNVYAGNTLLGVYEGQCGYEIPLLASNFSAKLAGATVAAVAGLAMGVAGAGAAVSTSAKMAKAIGSTNSQIGALAYSRSHGLPYADPHSFVTSQEMMAISKSNAPNLTREAQTYQAISSGIPHKIASASSSATAKQPVNVSRNGGFSGTSEGASIPYPFVVISRPKQDVPVGYGHHFGYPSNINYPLSMLKGYTEVGAIHLNGINALPDEIAELDDMLKGGIII